MPWHEPITWLFQQLVTERDLNEQIRDNLRVLKAPIDDNGKIKALSPETVASLDGSALTGVAKTGAGNSFGAGVQDFNGSAETRVVLPVGPDKWAAS